MSTNRRWHAPVAVTASRWLLQELRRCEQHAGVEFDYTSTIPDGRRHARCSPIVIIGFDLVPLVRKPMVSAGVVAVAVLHDAGSRVFHHAHRIGAPYVIALPAARPWLVDQLLHPPTG